MWLDIGLDDWLFDLDDPQDYLKIVPAILAMANDPNTAKARAEDAREVVLEKQQMEMDSLQKALATAIKR